MSRWSPLLPAHQFVLFAIVQLDSFFWLESLEVTAQLGQKEGYY